MTDPMTTEAARLALHLIRTDDPEENHRSFMAGLQSFEGPLDRLALSFNVMRFLALQIREYSKESGTLDHLLDHVDQELLELVIDEY